RLGAKVSDRVVRWTKVCSSLLDLDAACRRSEARTFAQLAGEWHDAYGALARFRGDVLEMIEDGEASAVQVQQNGQEARVSVLLYSDFWQANFQDGQLWWSSGEVWTHSSRSDARSGNPGPSKRRWYCRGDGRA
ncbi:unnamed protein product, partial [Effrenium voratum]